MNKAVTPGDGGVPARRRLSVAWLMIRSRAGIAFTRESFSAFFSSRVEAARHRELRDRLIRTLRADDPRRWTYPALAAAVGCSPELIAHIVKTGIVKTGIVKTGGGAKTES